MDEQAEGHQGAPASSEEPHAEAPAAHGHEGGTTITNADVDAHAAAEGAHGAAAEGAHHGGRHVTHPPELPHFVQIWFNAEHTNADGSHDYGDPHAGLDLVQVLHVGRLEKPAPFVDYAPWENNLFAGIAALFIIVVTWLITGPFRRKKEDVLRRPTKLQLAVEGLVAGTDSFVRGILGDDNGRRYMPYISALFYFILVMNLMGMVPLMKAPTSSVMITASLALMSYFYYLYVGATRLGPLTLLHHLLGSPQSAIQWVFAPLMIVLESISFFVARPLSLALRLFGNILGKDILFGVMLILGLMVFSFADLNKFIGFPLTYPFYFLGLLLSTIQALVFSLLSAIYILLVLPHDHDHDEHAHADHGHGEEHKKAHAH